MKRKYKIFLIFISLLFFFTTVVGVTFIIVEQENLKPSLSLANYSYLLPIEELIQKKLKQHDQTVFPESLVTSALKSAPSSSAISLPANLLEQEKDLRARAVEEVAEEKGSLENNLLAQKSSVQQRRYEWLLAMRKCRGVKNIKTKKKVVALTFDDGPNGKYTAEILEILKKYNVPATFFLIGKNALRYPQLIKEMLDNNHIVANHSFSHKNLSSLNPEDIAFELNKTSAIIFKIAGVYPVFFRPPYGICSDSSTFIAQQEGYKTVIWSDMTNDYDIANTTPKNIAEEIIDLAGPGGILALHDGGGNREKSVTALPIVIEALQKNGYTFLSLFELLKVNPYQVKVIDLSISDRCDSKTKVINKSRFIDTILIYASSRLNELEDLDYLIKKYLVKSRMPHYLIAFDGTIYRLLPEHQVSILNVYRTKISTEKLVKTNKGKIIIELMRNPPEKPSADQYHAMKSLVAVLQKIYPKTYVKDLTIEDSKESEYCESLCKL